MNDQEKKEMIKSDIQNLYFTGLTTMSSLSKTYGVSVLKLAKYEQEVIDEIKKNHSNKKYFPSGRELLLGELGMGESFLPKEYEGTNYAQNFYKTLQVNGKNILVENSEGVIEWMLNTTRVIIKTSTIG